MAVYGSLNSSGVSSCSEMDRCSGDETDEEDAFISFTTTESRCERLYEEGLELKCIGELQQALASFLKCLEGMQECQYFAKLPQTLNQLSDVYRTLQHFETAEAYSKAEKLFYEAIVTEPRVQATGDRHRTKRRAFSKNRGASSTAVCNPAEYGTLLNKKAEGFEKLARTCVTESKFELAQEYSSKAASIRQTVLGQRARSVSMQPLGGVSEVVPLKGDLSMAGLVGSICDSESNRTDESAMYTNERGLHAATTTDSKTSHSSHCQHNEGTLAANMAVPVQPNMVLSGANENILGNPSFPIGRVSSAPSPCGLMGSASTDKGCHEEGYKYHTRTDQECAHDDYPRQGAMNDVRLVSGVDSTLASGDETTSRGNAVPFRSNICAGVTNFSKFKKPMSRLADLKPMSKLADLKKPLSELKNPMCVNLDLHKSPGEDVAPTRCLPLWILLLPAFLALVGYIMYYH